MFTSLPCCYSVLETTDGSGAAEDSPSSVSVLLIDDHAAWRGGVRSLLEDTEFVVVAESASANDALEAARRTRPRLILLDIRMPGGDGLELLTTLKAELPESAVVMLTTYMNPAYVARAVADGAAGYLLKGIDVNGLLQALRMVVQGGLLMSPAALNHALFQVMPLPDGASEVSLALSDGDSELLRLMASGLDDRQIAGTLSASETDVSTRVNALLGKLRVSDRAQAAVWAVRHAVVPQDRP